MIGDGDNSLWRCVLGGFSAENKRADNDSRPLPRRVFGVVNCVRFAGYSIWNDQCFFRRRRYTHGVRTDGTEYGANLVMECGFAAKYLLVRRRHRRNTGDPAFGALSRLWSVFYGANFLFIGSTSDGDSNSHGILVWAAGVMLRGRQRNLKQLFSPHLVVPRSGLFTLVY